MSAPAIVSRVCVIRNPGRRLRRVRRLTCLSAESAYSAAEFGVFRGLEEVLHAELHHAAVLGRRDPAERGRRADRGGGIVEADLVEDIERLHPNLDPPLAAELDVLEERQVR